MLSDGELYKNIKEYLNKPDEDFKSFIHFLEGAVKIWNMKNRKSSYQFESLIQIYLADKCLDSFGENLRVNQSVKDIVEPKNEPGNSIYNKDKGVFKTSKNRYIRPDMWLVSKNEIQEILEIKTTPKFDVSWMMGDISRLLKTKFAFPYIKCYELMIDYGKKLGDKGEIKTFLGKSKSEDKKLFKTLLDKGLVVLKDDVITILSEEDIKKIFSDKHAQEIYDTHKEPGGIYGYIFSVEKKDDERGWLKEQKIF